MNKRYWLYVLKLESNKYYVGITSKSPEIRFKEHMGHYGAGWTKKYKPVAIHFKKDLGYIDKSRAEQYENKVVRKYIKKYGIDNVRGGDIGLTEDLVIGCGWWWSRKDLESLTIVTVLLAATLSLIIYILHIQN